MALAVLTGHLTRTVGVSGVAFVAAYLAASVATGQRNALVGNLAQLVPPLAYAALTLALARVSTSQVRVFWILNAIHALMWAAGQAVWTYYDLRPGGVPIVTPSDPIFYLSSIPLAAALYARPERVRPRWLGEIMLLDSVLIALFAVFVYLYFIVSLQVSGGEADVYDAHLTQLLNVRNLLLAAWAAALWRTSASPAWRRVFGVYALGLALNVAGGIVYDFVAEDYAAGGAFDLAWMLPYLVLALAAAQAYDQRLFAPDEPSTGRARLPVVSLIAVTMLVLIPTTDEITRRTSDVTPAVETLRTRLALAMMIPFGVVVVLREFLSRQALLRAGHDLLAAREQLAQNEKLAAVGQLVSGVAHELNNPLQGVLGYAELMSMSRQEQTEPEELRAIRESATRAAGIVRNLLTFAGGETRTRSWHQINTIVRTAVARRAPFLHDARIDCDLGLADRVPLAYLDAARFEQVFVNLIENAEAAIALRRSGRSRSTALDARVPGRISIETRREPNPDRIVIEVADNGSGVRTEDLSRVFDPFFTTREAGEGQGLGLSVCYGIVREHGGAIRARNRDMGGAAFEVELPVASDAFMAQEAPAARPAAAVHAPPRDNEDAPATVLERKRRALVVDDEDSNAALVRRALDQAGYEVESTTLSRRALVMIERAPYDVVIADVRMPELSGPELFTRACQIRPEMAGRFIFITGDIDGEDTRQFLERSRCSYFMKPFNLERLTAAVDLLVAGRKDEVQ